MKKKLNEIGIANELRGSSVYFQPSATPDAQETTETKPRKRTPSARKTAVETAVSDPETGSGEQPLTVQPAVQPAPPTPLELSGPTPVEALPTSTQESTQESTQAQMIETIRKAVKRLGKETSFCRFTQDEKNALSDIVYTYKRNGVRTSENEMVRIAINWLIENYQTDGQNSVLAQVLDRLNA